MLILDTDSLSIIQQRVGVAYARLVARLPAADPQSVFVTIITFEEQMRGWLTYVARARSSEQQVTAYARLHAYLRDFSRRQILDFDAQTASQYRLLVQSKIRIGTMDLRIAAIVLTHGATLLSRNLTDYRKVPGLQVEDWTRP